MDGANEVNRNVEREKMEQKSDYRLRRSLTIELNLVSDKENFFFFKINFIMEIEWKVWWTGSDWC